MTRLALILAGAALGLLAVDLAHYYGAAQPIPGMVGFGVSFLAVATGLGGMFR
jgi:hypothetical protein